MITGWIKLHRRFIEWEWYDNSNVMRVFLHCLLLANHKDKKWRGKLIKRGTFITSYGKLSSALKLSMQQVRTALDKLSATNEISLETTNKYTIITVCNYKTYQESDSKNNNQITDKKQSNNNQITTTKNDKNVKNDNNNGRQATVPSLDEVKEYFVEKGYDGGLAKKFYSYYQEPMEDRNGRVWKDQNGKTVKSWKQKAISVWMKEDNKKQESNVIDGGLW